MLSPGGFVWVVVQLRLRISLQLINIELLSAAIYFVMQLQITILVISIRHCHLFSHIALVFLITMVNTNDHKKFQLTRSKERPCSSTRGFYQGKSKLVINGNSNIILSYIYFPNYPFNPSNFMHQNIQIYSTLKVKENNTC